LALSDWLHNRQERRYTRLPPPQPDLPDGAWSKCEACGKLVHATEFVRSSNVCPGCSHHFAMSPAERIGHLTDPDSLEEWDAALTAVDPLSFVGGEKSYQDSIGRAKEKTCGEEAVVTGRATLDGRPLAVGVMDFSFIGGSMGSVVGEKVARMFERAGDEKVPALMVCTSGGARMQEGSLSLFQMAKTSAAVHRFREAGRPYLSLLADPTTGGVSASFATLADVILAEPGALIGFTGPRVIEQTIRQKLPKDFQSAEFMLAHGLVDMVVPRETQRETISTLLDLLGGPDA
jgi:acetyl-CoA carboxylase carboxyl transferase subunit beta